MIARHIGSLLGDSSRVTVDPQGVPVVAPLNEHECALILATASERGWRVRIEGNASWIAADAPADLSVTTRSLRGIDDVSPADLVASVRVGTPWDDLRVSLLDHGAWIPLDPPGTDRSVGSVVATASAGPLRAAFGSIRDQILGLTFVTGDGRVIRVGGRVVKNVAGYDVTKLLAGSFGAFGVIISVNFRLRSVPRCDHTLVAGGERDTLIGVARAVLESGATPAALELVSPSAGEAGSWTLALRLLGSEPSVAAQLASAADVTAPVVLRRLEPDRAGGFWRQLATGAVAADTTLRIGALPSAMEVVLDLLAHHFDEKCEDWITATLTAGTVRWTGHAAPDRIRLFRGVCAQQEMPVTLERAPWDVRGDVGHFGAYRSRVPAIVESVRRTFDPAAVLAVPLSMNT
jgi:glycolate oxidase FAD binding subunit